MVTGAAHRPSALWRQTAALEKGSSGHDECAAEEGAKGAACGPFISGSPVKRAHGGKATSSVGLARSMDRNYKRFVMFENRARYLADPEHHGVLRGDLDGDQDLLQEELDLMRKRIVRCHWNGFGLSRTR
jgi:hypothetical protein